MDVRAKIAILADAAKYDASCSTSGSARRPTPGGIGNGAVGGICHSWSSDGRCVALLKVLLTNVCLWDCAYCVNRRSNDLPRASFEPDELVGLIIDFYKRNYIEGALLSSGVFSAPDTVMERLISVARTLRERERFSGYLHLKAIPGASDALVNEAARWADRVSVNIELPSAASLALVAPDKTPEAIFRPMRALARAGGFEPRRLVSASQTGNALAADNAPATRTVARNVERNPASGGTGWPCDLAARDSAAEPVPSYAREDANVMEARKSRRRDPAGSILPAGQTTQLVIGASPESDAAILTLAENLYLAYDVRRVYYSAYVPVGSSSLVVPGGKPPLLREHRLYQADWLFRFYGFRADEILDDSAPFLDPALDPKCAWALRNIHLFPIDANAATYLELLRVPGIGPKSASRIVRARRAHPLSADELGSLGVAMKRARFFVSCSGRLSSTLRLSRSNPGLDRPELLRPLLSDGLASLATQLEFDWGHAS